MKSQHALKRFMQEKPKQVLDIGSGDGQHAEVMRSVGIEVVTIDDQNDSATYIGDYLFLDTPKRFSYDAIWCSHVLEHQRDVGVFLDKIQNDLPEGGLLAITVPPLRKKIVGGHLNQFTPASLIYNMVLAGFDCSAARVATYDYNISVIVYKRSFEVPYDLTSDEEGLNRLLQYFPWKISHGSSGLMPDVNW